MDILIKRGTTKAVENYVGKSGELVLDSETRILKVMDGTTKGGKSIKINGNYVVDTGKVGNYFYRKWNDGFIEQWGSVKNTTSNTIMLDVSLPIPYSNKQYYASMIKGNPDDIDGHLGTSTGMNYDNFQLWYKTTTTFRIKLHALTSDIQSFSYGCWYTCGY